ncbi:MAG: 30S ribosomal protein S12 methylthiotransferase RimO [Bacteroidetes bacterium]|nr:30S ribosomal protein S12 methylthiotransferase RimO [Bacteroidota bacterium]
MTDHTPPSRISIITLGCSKNTVDSEVLMRQIEQNRFTLVDDPNDADTVIINTCGFIDVAKEESVNTIVEAAEMKKTGAIRNLYVAGCLSERYRADLEKELPEVDRFFGVTDFKNILETLGGSYKYELLGERHLTTPRHSAYLKISEGCDRPCSFCSIPLMRGGHVSRPMDDIVREAEFLATGGTKELVLIAQDTTYYGLDLHDERQLAPLLSALADVHGLEWIRLMYAYPSRFPLEALDVIRERNNICNYIDIPIQHINDDVLKSMRRGITRRATEELLETMRARVPGIAIRSTLIVGYPNESEAAFQELYDFVAAQEFDRLGVFLYSQEENTTAHILGDPLPHEVKEERRAAIMELQAEISQRKNEAKIGQHLRVLVDGAEGNHVVARSEHDAPEVDNEVLIPLEEFGGDAPAGRFVDVTVVDANEFDLIATRGDGAASAPPEARR